MKNRYENAFLDYYKKHDIAPVSQDISDLDKHFERRNALYRHCGIPSSLIEGKSVLEIGPGTGHNALFTNAMKPQKYVLVDGNPRSIQETTRLLNTFFPDVSNCEIIESSFENFTSNTQFDLVICEGTIPAQKDPHGFLKSVSEFTKPSGLLLITCVDHVSYVSEILRKVAAALLIDGKVLTEDEKLNKLRPFFLPHIATLKGMSRPIDDWIYDQILQPVLGSLLSIEDAIKCLSSEFNVYGASPHFFIDWRWYKDIYANQQQYNELAIDSYIKNIHNLLDYRYVFEPIEPETGRSMAHICQSIFEIANRIRDAGINSNSLSELRSLLNKLSILTSKFSSGTTESLQQFICALDEFLAGKSFPSRLERFEPWFGRGQQYVSFIRKDKKAHALSANRKIT